VIENNASAIRALEPLAEEIELLQKCKVRPLRGWLLRLLWWSPALPWLALQSFNWQFRLDKRSLSVLHLKAIARVYGDYGNEMLELLRKNPAGAIKIILKRLKQKDGEWRRARLDLNKEVLEKNYQKSLDHRSFYFNQSDKKQVHQRTLVSEMRARVDAWKEAHEKGTKEGEDAAAPARTAKRLPASGAQENIDEPME
ncbi:SNL1, partial [Symbiodinium sp. KB8]